MNDAFSSVHWLASTELPADFLGTNIRCGFEGVGFQAPSHFHRARQVHGIHIEVAGDQTDGQRRTWPEADGLVTTDVGKIIAVKTADCLPIILADLSGAVAYVVHAGWRGLAGGIVDKACKEIQARGGPIEQIRVAIGPSITLPNYEVGPEVAAVFEKFPHCFYKGANDRWQIDIAGIAAHKLLRLGLAPHQIAVVRSCTFAHPRLWNSYRREGRVVASNWTWCEILRSDH